MRCTYQMGGSERCLFLTTGRQAREQPDGRRAQAAAAPAAVAADNTVRVCGGACNEIVIMGEWPTEKAANLV